MQDKGVRAYLFSAVYLNEVKDTKFGVIEKVFFNEISILWN